jgi:predicted ABC-type ATPase
MPYDGRPSLLIVAGPNGSGKTTVTRGLFRLIWTQDSTYVNPDIIAQEKYGDWNSPKAIFQAAKYAVTIRNQCLAEGRDLIFETVLSSTEKPEYLRRAMEAGYFIRLLFIATSDPYINCARVTARRMKGGHDVPTDKIITRYVKSIANCAVLAPLVDRLQVYDNSANRCSPRPVLRASNGRLTRTYGEVPEWALPIKANLTPIHNLISS